MVNKKTRRTTKLQPVLTLRVSGPDIREGNAGNFFQGWTFEQLVNMQAVRPMRDVKTLAGGWPQDEDVDEVLTEIYRRRH